MTVACRPHILIFVLGLLASCGHVAPGDEPDEVGDHQAAGTIELPGIWQPFQTTSVFNLKLSPTRSETALPQAVQGAGIFAPSDQEFGVKVYFAKASDPLWSVSYTYYNSWLDTWSNPNPVQIRGPANMTPPAGWDGSVILVDEQRRYAYEFFLFKVTGTNRAQVYSVEVVDLASSGVHRNVGITAGGVPGIGALLKSRETSLTGEIRHKLWMALSPNILYAAAVSPCSRWDVSQNGANAFFKYGDVIAISKNVNLDQVCGLSPFIKRIAKAMQDYGAIVMDQGGDGFGIVSEVGAVKDYLDVSYSTTMWQQFACLKPYLVKVNDPWTGATPGGLGVGGTQDASPPTPPTGVAASAASSTQVSLRWNASTDNIGVSGYKIFRNSTQIASASSLSFTDSSVAPGSSNSYFVRAYDAAGNTSPASSTASVTTPPTSGGGGSTGGTELLQNPGFESGSSPWLLQQWNGKPVVTTCTDRRRSGTRSFCVTSKQSESGAAVSPYIAVSAGSRYTFSAWMYLQGVTWGKAVIKLDWYRSDGSLVSSVTSTGKSQSTTTWGQETITATAPSGATKALVFLFSYATGKVYYDDVSFKKQ
jgi:hypothetical protein